MMNEDAITTTDAAERIADQIIAEASREPDIIVESHGHPNQVYRYSGVDARGQKVYYLVGPVALRVCPCCGHAGL